MKTYKYRTSFGKFAGGEIEQFEVIEETDYYMKIINPILTTGDMIRGFNKIAHPHEETLSKPFFHGHWYNTWEEARAEKLKRAKDELETARKELVSATDEVQRLLALAKPEEGSNGLGPEIIE